MAGNQRQQHSKATVIEWNSIINNFLSALMLGAILWVGNNIIDLREEISLIAADLRHEGYRITQAEEDIKNNKKEITKLKDFLFRPAQ